MFRDDDDRGSTYDYVPQTVTSGLGTPLTFPKTEKEDNRNIDQKIYDGMVSFGARFFGSQKESTSDYVLDVYENSPMFRIPTVPEVTVQGIGKSFEQKLQEMFDSQGQNVYTPEIEGTGSYDEVPAPSTNKNLMRNRINNILKDVIAPNSKEYEIQKGDTLSDISLREGVSVEDLAQVNEIENPNMILEGGTLIIPQVQEMEKAKEYVLRVTTRGDESLVDLTDPDAQFYQSGVPMDQRDFAPERSYLDNQPQSRGLMVNTGNPDYNFMSNDSKFVKALKEKEADNYDTIFGNAEKRNTPFKGTKISDKTISEVLEFVKLNGKFHTFNKQKGKNTTAVGKYQIVGDTLRDLNNRGVLKKLGITDDTKFDEKTQDDIAAYIAVHRIKDRATGEIGGDLATRGSARREMRNAWEGFKSLSDDELDAIIDEIADEVNVDIINVVPSVSTRPQSKPES
jgi:LysM repeat protein